MTELNTQNGVSQSRPAHAGVPLGGARPAPAQKAASERAKSVAICDTQPVTAEGIRNLLAGSSDLQFSQSPVSLNQAREFVRVQAPDVLLLDKAFGIQAILDFLSEAGHSGNGRARTNIVIWGVSVTEAEALRFLQGGARGILRKSAPVNAVLACLRTVAEGRTWMEDSVFRDGLRADRYPRSELTSREQQVLELVEQGLQEQGDRERIGYPSRHGEDSLEAHLRKNRHPGTLRPGAQRSPGAGTGFRYGLIPRNIRPRAAGACSLAVPSQRPRTAARRRRFLRSRRR